MKSINRSPHQYADYNTEEDVSTADEYKEYVGAIDHMLIQRQEDISPFFTRCRHENTEVQYFLTIIWNFSINQRE